MIDPLTRKVGRLGLLIVLGCFASADSFGQTLEPTTSSPRYTHSGNGQLLILLDKQAASEIRTEGLPETELKLIAKLPANFYHFGAARAGEVTEARQLTFRFAATTKLTGIHSTPDFKVEQGGSCVEGNVYKAESSCTMLIRFAPRGAGHRVGKLTVSHSAGAAPLSIGLNGYGYSPAISFTPAVITTVPGTFPAGKGLLYNAASLAVDGGDGLYIADYGNKLVRYIDSSGAIITIAGGGSSPISGFAAGPATSFNLSGPFGIATDGLGNAYVGDTLDSEVLQLDAFGDLYTFAGGGSVDPFNCEGSPCVPTSVVLTTPEGVAVDPSGNVFFRDGTGSLDEFSSSISLLTTNLHVPYFPGLPGVNPLVDGSGNLYLDTFERSVCYIVGENTAYSNRLGGNAWIVAGTRTCGFSGDGGQARNAQIGLDIYQMAFDLAGNLYFSDTGNNRVRRIDGVTGIINTIAGNGNASYNGDGGPATNAGLKSPTGVAVDSQGQVYIVSFSAATGVSQVIRKVGPNGALAFPGPQVVNTASAAKTVTIANTGNDTLVVTRIAFTGANAGDFSVDPNTTSCNFTVNQALASGKSCLIGIVSKPTATGPRTADLVLLDNTVTNSNIVQLTGSAVLVPKVTIVAPAAGATFTSGTAIKFTVTVSSASNPAPTGAVTFSVDGKVFGSPVAIASGTASVNLTGLTVATHTLSATYSGDINYAAATASESLIVKAAAAKSKVALVAGANPASVGKEVTFLATVKADPKMKPTGELLLQEGTTLVGKSRLLEGNAVIVVPRMSTGTHWLTAVYAGDHEHGPATSPQLREVIK